MEKTKKDVSALTTADHNRTGPRRSLRKCSKGLSTVEYIVLLVLVAVGCILAWQGFRDKVILKLGGAGDEIVDMK